LQLSVFGGGFFEKMDYAEQWVKLGHAALFLLFVIVRMEDLSRS
jgi:hypothetical protein